jgi:CBS domain-containing protein
MGLYGDDMDSPSKPTVHDVMRPAVTTVERQAHLAAAAFLMHRAGDSAVVITAGPQNPQPVAVITEADVTATVAEGRDVNEVRIGDLIGKEPVMIGPDATVGAAAELMLSHGIHHLPVVEDDRLVGIVDIADACRALLGQAA